MDSPEYQEIIARYQTTDGTDYFPLQTERLMVEPIVNNTTCIENVFQTLNHDMIAQNISFFTHPMTMDQAENWCELAQEGWDGDTSHLFIVRHRESGEMIGCISAEDKLKDYDAYEVGYWLVPSAQKQGFALEMLIRILDHIADYFAPQRIIATTALDNDASASLLEKCGFAYIGLEDVPTPDPEYFRPSRLYARPLADTSAEMEQEHG